jgi:predicted nucleotidyltransferase component of viral defense system
LLRCNGGRRRWLRSSSTVLDADELGTVARSFGVADAQVRRDHLISHLLGAIERLDEEHSLRLVFFGGTALARTHLTEGRLSEDIDLFCVDRVAAVAVLADSLPRALRRTHGLLRWDPSLREAREVDGARLVSDDGTAVRVQVIEADVGYRLWPTERRQLVQRFSDAPEVAMRVPTRRAFVAMKASAWRERQAARDLFDLRGLADIGAIDAEAVRLVSEATGAAIVEPDFAVLPRDLAWVDQLAHQTRDLSSAEECLSVVRAGWGRAAGWHAR